jgi:pimeloyl-ACP methyl ester carboxylesterase
VLLHGFPQTSACWTALLETLAAAGYRAVAPDQRGYSPKARPTPVRADRLPELVADVLAIADRLGAETFHLVGHDWGGVVAWRLAGGHPDRVATLTAVSTPLHQPSPGRWSPAPRRCGRPTSAVPDPSAARAAAGRAPAGGLHWLPAQDGLGANWIDTYTRALAHPRVLSAALAWHRAATPFSPQAPPARVPPLAARAPRRGAGSSAARAPPAVEHPARRRGGTRQPRDFSAG